MTNIVQCTPRATIEVRLQQRGGFAVEIAARSGERNSIWSGHQREIAIATAIIAARGLRGIPVFDENGNVVRYRGERRYSVRPATQESLIITRLSDGAECMTALTSDWKDEDRWAAEKWNGGRAQ